MITTLFKISTPAPTGMLEEELKELFKGRTIEHLTHDEYESCVMFNLSYLDMKLITENVGDVLIHEVDYTKGKEIIIK